MIIAFVSDSIYPYHKGGKEKRLYELSTRLVKLGHEVHIYTMHWWESKDKQVVENGVQLHAISNYRDMYSGDRRSIAASLKFGLASTRMWGVRADVIDVDHMPFFPVYGVWAVTKLRGKKMYGTWHEALSRQDWTNYMGQAGNISYMIEHISIKLPQHITVSSPHTLELLDTYHGRSKRLSLVTPGIDTKLMKSIKPVSRKIDVLYIGRLVKDKNIDKLVKAIDILVKQGTKVQCVIVGHGIEKHNLENQIKKLKLTGHIAMLEPIAEDKDVYAYMKAAKVFCFPSVREGFGMVALESLGCGTPVITTNAPPNAARKLITDGVNGSVVSPTPQDLAKAIKLWISKPKKKHIAADVAGYDWDNLAKLQAEAYVV